MTANQPDKRKGAYRGLNQNVGILSQSLIKRRQTLICQVKGFRPFGLLVY
jgi:hypothetical protein